MSVLRVDRVVDLLEYTDGPGGPPLPTENPFDPYSNWWTRRRADAPCYAEVVRGILRDFIFGDREGEFWRFFFDRGLLTAIGRPDSDLGRRWLLRQEAPDLCWLIDFRPRIYDAPLPHIEAYCLALDQTPQNAD